MKIYEGRIVYNLVSEGKGQSFTCSSDAASYLKNAFNEYPFQEQLIVIPLNTKNRPLGRFTISLGSANATIVDPKDIFKPSILAGASAFVVGHNHPSGDPAPSTADQRTTDRLKEAGNILNIQLLDHLIIGTPEDDPTGQGYFSFADHGLM